MGSINPVQLVKALIFAGLFAVLGMFFFGKLQGQVSAVRGAF